MLRSATPFLLLAGLVGCGPATPGNNNMNNMNGDQPDLAQAAAPQPDMAKWSPGPYPAGPYGTEIGDTIRAVDGRGYALTPENTDVGDLKIKTVSIELLRGDERCRTIMLVQSAVWCVPCNNEQPVLIEAALEDPSFCVFNLLLEGNQGGKPAVDADLTTWNRHQQTFPIVKADIGTKVAVPRPTAFPTNVVICAKDMKIADIEAGLKPTSIDDAKALCSDDTR